MILGDFNQRIPRKFTPKYVHAELLRVFAPFNFLTEGELDGAPGLANPLGDPVVSNGLSLCKLHHAAFDRHFIGIRPDYMVEVRRDLLEEEDGPMLLHGLQGMHATRIQVPRKAVEKPDPALLERRYEEFRSAV